MECRMSIEKTEAAIYIRVMKGEKSDQKENR